MVTVGAMQGWQCPVCGRVLAPFMMECPCKGQPQTTTTTDIGTVNVTVDGKEIADALQKYMRGAVSIYNTAVK